MLYGGNLIYCDWCASLVVCLQLWRSCYNDHLSSWLDWSWCQDDNPRLPTTFKTLTVSYNHQFWMDHLSLVVILLGGTYVILWKWNSVDMIIEWLWVICDASICHISFHCCIHLHPHTNSSFVLATSLNNCFDFECCQLLTLNDPWETDPWRQSWFCLAINN